MIDIADPEIGLAFRFLVGVENDLLAVFGLPCAPAEEGVLCAFDKPRVVGEGAVRRGYGTVVLLDAALHFLEERFAKFGERFERFFRIGVLRFEIGANIAVERVRIAHHLAPVLVAKPGVVVDPDNAVVFVGLRPFFGARRRRGRCQFHVCAFNRRRRRRA